MLLRRRHENFCLRAAPLDARFRSFPPSLAFCCYSPLQLTAGYTYLDGNCLDGHRHVGSSLFGALHKTFHVPSHHRLHCSTHGGRKSGQASPRTARLPWLPASARPADLLACPRTSKSTQKSCPATPPAHHTFLPSFLPCCVGQRAAHWPAAQATSKSMATRIIGRT